MSTSTDAVTVELPVADRLVVVLGSGPRAAATTSALLDRGARVRVAGASNDDLTPSLADLAVRGRIEFIGGDYHSSSLTGAWLVYPRTGDAELDRAISADAADAHVWCIADVEATDAGLQTQGRVTILGGGPGDPELITVRGRDALATADVVVFDRLAPVSLLATLPSSTILVDAAKVPGGRAMPQREINRHLVEHASLGRHVVRLKGGDPFVFGRGMEEIDACTAAGIAVDVIPGVTSAIGVPGLAGVSLTHRGLAHAFTVVSGHLSPESPQSTVDWDSLARSGATLVLMMAVETLPAITARLMAAGMDPETPAATVQEGASPAQRTVRSTLADLARDAAGVRPPAVTVIGPVAAHIADLTPARERRDTALLNSLPS